MHKENEPQKELMIPTKLGTLSTTFNFTKRQQRVLAEAREMLAMVGRVDETAAKVSKAMEGYCVEKLVVPAKKPDRVAEDAESSCELEEAHATAGHAVA